MGRKSCFAVGWFWFEGLAGICEFDFRVCWFWGVRVFGVLKP